MRVSSVFVLHILYANEGRSVVLHFNAIPRSGQFLIGGDTEWLERLCGGGVGRVGGGGGR